MERNASKRDASVSVGRDPEGRNEEIAEHVDSSEDAGELLHPLVDKAETEEATKAQTDGTRPTRRIWSV